MVYLTKKRRPGVTWEARTLEDGSKKYVIAFVPMSDYVGTTHHTLKGTYFQQVDPKGLIPKFLVNSTIVSGLTFLSDMRKKFDKSLEVDQARRAELVPKIEQLPVGEGAGAVEAQFLELFTERKGSEEIKLDLGSAKSRIKAEKVRVSE